MAYRTNGIKSNLAYIKLRFWSKVNKTETCWIWTASYRNKDGYGSFRYKGKCHLAHRIAWIFTYGETINQILHKCDNPKCVRPSHLFEGTHQDNMKDRDDKKRLPCREGENNSNAKINFKIATKIRNTSALGGISVTELSILFKLEKTQIRRILNNEVWNDLKLQ